MSSKDPSLRTPHVFISYRRDDTDGHAGRLYDSLAARFGEENVFMDIDSIEPGADFVEVINERVASCDVVLAVIGRNWLTAADGSGRRRLSSSRDWVRREIQAALEGRARLIPVLVQGTLMPEASELPRPLAQLSRRNAFSLGARWHADVARLIEIIEDRPASPAVTASSPTRSVIEAFQPASIGEIWSGSTSPLGATFDGDGTNFSIYSETAERIDVCLFGDDGQEVRLTLPEKDGAVWHGYVPGLPVGALYGFRVHGPHDPERGLLHNPAKLLVDPYAKAIDGDMDFADDSLFGSTGPDRRRPDPRDSAPHVAKSVVADVIFDWGDDRPPRLPWSETVIYETHVKGITARHPGVPDGLRGTFAGLASDATIEHLLGLGVTAVELQPVHHFLSDRSLLKRGLTNYWGYNSLGFFAPHAGYSSDGGRGGQVRQFKSMVKALHAAGLEVILDVVYGHTAEGDHRGPTLCFRGIDNATYYRLSDDDRSRYVDYTGCGNTLNTRHRAVLALIMDSLRYWVSEMHVDGFRFDQASTLVRGLHEVDQLSAFFDLIHQDPIMSTVKLIAEPWDVGEGGYQVGKFPAQWAEWNGDYRDAVRDFWRGKGAGSTEMATRLIGSTDLYQAGGRRPYASVNFVTAHDGFTLHDLVTYSTKRNEANGEDNRDGVDDERSWNCGVEGETDDPDVVSLRRRQQRNFLATLLLSQGVPMLFGGDEIDRTQHGNNNAYCQDNEVNWYDWDLSSHAEELLDFTRRLIALRHAHPVFRRSRFFEAEEERGRGTPDVAWFGPDGREMTNMERSAAGFKSLGMFLNGESIREAAVRGPHVANDSFLMIMNAGDPLRFQLPEMRWAWTYEVAINTAFAGGLPPDGQGATAGAGESLDVDELSVLLLRKLS